MDMEAQPLTPPSPGAEQPRARKPRARPLEAVVKARIKTRFTVRIDVETGAMCAAIAKEAGLRGKAGVWTVMEELLRRAADSEREPAAPIRPVREAGVRRGGD